MNTLKDKVVFITGSITGLGVTLAVAAAQAGAAVVVADSHRQHYDAASSLLDAFGQNSLFVPVDVANAESVQQAIKTVEQQFGRFDVALNCPIITKPFADFHELSEEVWQRIIELNLTGTFHCLKYEVQHFLRQRGGIIINLASPAGKPDMRGLAAHQAAQQGVLSLASTIATQYTAQHIRCNTLSPYYTTSPPPDYPLGDGSFAARLATATEIIGAFLYLASDESRHCNGVHWALAYGDTTFHQPTS